MSSITQIEMKAIADLLRRAATSIRLSIDIVNVASPPSSRQAPFRAGFDAEKRALSDELDKRALSIEFEIEAASQAEEAEGPIPIPIPIPIPKDYFCANCGREIPMPPDGDCETPERHTFPQPTRQPQTEEEIAEVQANLRAAIAKTRNPSSITTYPPEDLNR